jgi:hypothetical protein
VNKAVHPGPVRRGASEPDVGREPLHRHTRTSAKTRLQPPRYPVRCPDRPNT